MESENQEATNCADNDEYRVYSKIFVKLCKERFYKNQLKSGTHITNTRNRQKIK